MKKFRNTSLVIFALIVALLAAQHMTAQEQIVILSLTLFVGAAITIEQCIR